MGSRTALTQQTVDPCAYVRATYGVPATVGMRVRIQFVQRGMASQTGVIKGADHRLFVLLDGEKTVRSYHPDHLIDYIGADGAVIHSCGDE